MFEKLYKITGWSLITIGIIWIIINQFIFFRDEIGVGILFSVLIFGLSFFPGKYYLKISDDESKHNKLTNSSVHLTIIGIIILVIFSVIALIACPLPDMCRGYGFLIIYIGLFPGACFSAIALILLIKAIFDADSFS